MPKRHVFYFGTAFVVSVRALITTRIMAKLAVVLLLRPIVIIHSIISVDTATTGVIAPAVVNTAVIVTVMELIPKPIPLQRVITFLTIPLCGDIAPGDVVTIHTTHTSTTKGVIAPAVVVECVGGRMIHLKILYVEKKGVRDNLMIGKIAMNSNCR